MKRMNQKTFCLNNGHFCPFCKSEEVGTLENSVAFLETDRVCYDCKKKWTEKHKIIGYQEIKDEETI